MEIIDLIIVGAGGHSAVILDIINSINKHKKTINIVGFLDDNDKLETFQGYPILGKVENISDYYTNDNMYFIVGIGDNYIRRSIVEKYLNINYITLIHETAVIGSDINIGNGTVIMPNVTINARTNIGEHSILNTGSIIEHDNNIGEFSHISPGVVLCGGVNIGENAHIGANSTVIQYKSIGDNCIIGAGSTVVRDIKSNSLAVGSPAKIIKEIRW